jgi:glyoxylase-like metal-dependent hydrolase (beta-lactamase superfamily II)
MAAVPPPGVAVIPVPSPFAIGAVNAYLLEDEPLTLVDPGPRTGEALAALEAGLADRGRRIEDVELLLLTHQHHDHVGLAEAVRERSGAAVAGTPELRTFLADFDAAMDADDAYAMALMHRHGVDPVVAGSLGALSRGLRGLGGGVVVDRALSPGEELDAGGRRLRVLARPGHSPTDTVFHAEADGILVGGDHLLEHVSSNPVAHCPVGTEDPAALAGSPARPRALPAYLASMAATAALEVSLVLPGHGDPFTGHAALVARRERLHRRRAERILREADGEASAAGIAARLWRKVPVSQAFLALSEVLGHLDLLVEAGLVSMREDDGLERPVRTPAGEERAAREEWKE